MLEFLKKLFTSTSSSAPDETTIREEAGLAPDPWTWGRADEYPFDHYTEAVEEVKDLKREREHDEVEELLLWCIDYVEAEADHEARKDRGIPAIAPWYYEHLGIVYRKEDRYADEVEILERYIGACEDIGTEPEGYMLDRLENARSKAATE